MDERGVVFDERYRLCNLDRPAVGATGINASRSKLLRSGCWDRGLRALAGSQRLGYRVLLEVDRVQTHERGRLAEGLVDFMFLFEQTLEDREVASHLVVVGLSRSARISGAWRWP